MSVDSDAAYLVSEYEALYLLVGILLIGTVLLHLTSMPSVQGLPVTVAFFVLGIGFALMEENTRLRDLRALRASYEAWSSIDPHLMLYTFLPPLLFCDAFSVDTHLAQRVAGQCLLLAAPGVIIGAFSIAGVVYGALPYDWDFSTSFMVGALLSATDPVAVVTLLKDLGVSPILMMQIEGESMLNDGTAMVIFSVAYGVVSGTMCGFGCVLAYLLKSTLGAWVLGTVIGWCTFWWIEAASDKLSHRSTVIQVLLTVVCAYMSFLVADGLFGMSGVLSTVAAALVLAHLMWPVIVERRAMLEFWHLVEVIGNTVVFFLAGMLAGRSITQHVHFNDFLWALVLYLAMMAIRLLTITCLWPLLNRSGQEVKLSDIVVMTWGGLRGIVALALAIVVEKDRAKGVLTEEDSQKILFLVCCIAALTLVVNATTAPMLCGVLGLTKTVEARKVLMRNVARHAEQAVRLNVHSCLVSGSTPRECMLGPVLHAIDDLHSKVKHHVFGEGDQSSKDLLHRSDTGLDLSMERVHRLTRVSISALRGSLAGSPQPPSDVTVLWERFEKGKREVLSAHVPLARFRFGGQLNTIRQILAEEAVEPKLMQVVREVFLELVRASYWKQIQDGLFEVKGREPVILLNSVSLALDSSCKYLADWEVLRQDVGWPGEDAGAESRAAVLGGGRRIGFSIVQTHCQRRFFRRQIQSLQLVSAFLKAQQEAQSQIVSYFGQGDLIDSAEQAFVILESQANVFSAMLVRSQVSVPVQRSVATAWEIQRLCDGYLQFVHTAHEKGVLHPREAEVLLEPVVEVLQTLHRRRARMSHEFAAEASAFLLDASANRAGSLYEVDAAVILQRAFRRQRLLQRRTTLAGAAAELAVDSPGAFPLPTLLGRTRGVNQERIGPVEKAQAFQRQPCEARGSVYGRCSDDSIEEIV